jgi:hypothetical protein
MNSVKAFVITSPAADQDSPSVLEPLMRALRGLWHHPLLMIYNLLAISVVALNFFFFLASKVETAAILDLMILNFFVATAVRQQNVINLFFAIAMSVPKRAPLWIRWFFGKVYHFGGLHVGAYFSGSLWMVLLLFKLMNSPGVHGLISLYAGHVMVLLAVMVVSLPQIRSRFHNQFEIVARYGNWISLYLFWAENIYWHRLNPQSSVVGINDLLLILSSLCVISPWLSLRKVPVKIETPSRWVSHLTFDYGVTPFPGSSVDLSLSPLKEWHSFANIPVPHTTGYRLAVARAGDWTGMLNETKPSHIWVKGIPAAGVGHVEKLFSKVVWIATGSGIGPCMPHLLTQEIPAHLVWSTKNPEKTYGQDFYKEIIRVQPHALIWDTDKLGKPDLVGLAMKAVKETGAEAVICISNKPTTWQVAYELECQGIPTFGAIWDS